MSKYSSKQTLVYKSVGEIDFCVDCHLPDETKFSHVASVTRHILKSAALGFGSRGEVQQEVDSSLPVLLFFHGGGLSVGVRSLEKMASPWLLSEWPFAHARLEVDPFKPAEDALDAGFAVISADYSLFHPGNGYDIVSDVKDCLEFIATRLNKILARTTSQQVNPERIVVAGVSAGGYVAYLAVGQNFSRQNFSPIAYRQLSYRRFMVIPDQRPCYQSTRWVEIISWTIICFQKQYVPGMHLFIPFADLLETGTVSCGSSFTALVKHRCLFLVCQRPQIVRPSSIYSFLPPFRTPTIVFSMAAPNRNFP